MISMQYLIINAIQEPSYPHEKEYGGASISCWMKDQTEEDAAGLAKAWVEKSGWIPLSILEQYPVTEASYDNNSEGREYFEQALIDGEVFVFHTCPKDAKA